MYALNELIEDPEYLAELKSSLTNNQPPPLLRDAKIKITSRCNLKCQMCQYWHNKTEDVLTTPQWFNTISQMAELGCRKIHFSGGEVFLRRDFLDIVEHAVSCGIKVNMTTNGTLVTREKADRIVRLGVNSVSTSLDGPTAKLHDGIRGQEGAFKRTVRMIRRLSRQSAGRKKPLKIRINFVIMRKNYKKLPDMVRLAGELGAIELNPMPVDEKGERVARLSRQQIDDYNQNIAPEVIALRNEYGFSMRSDKIYPFGVTPRDLKYAAEGQYARGYFEKQPCLAPWLHMFVAWDGKVYLCCMTNGRVKGLGNVRKKTVKEIFMGPKYQQIRNDFGQRNHFDVCSQCDLFPSENRMLIAAMDGHNVPLETPNLPNIRSRCA